MRPEWLLFAWLVLFYTLGTCGFVYTPDGSVMGRVAYSIVHGQGLTVDSHGIPPGFLAQGTDGRTYGKFGAGLSLLSVPHALLGRALVAIAPSHAVDLFTAPRILWYRPREPSAAWHFFALSLLGAWIAAGTCALLFSLLRRVGYAPAVALVVTGVAALASPLWPYARDYFSEPLGGLGLIGFALAAEIYDGRRKRGEPGTAVPALLAGLALGLTILAKVAHFVLLPAGATIMLLFLRVDGSSWKPRWRDAGGFVLGVSAMVLVVAWYNSVRFGSIFSTGYGSELNLWSTPILLGLRGLLLSPGHGLLWYFPVLALAALYTPLSYRRTPRWTVFTWISLLALLGIYSRWYAWDAGWCWGPRFLVPIVPLLALVAAPFFASQPRRRVWRWGGWLLLAASFWIAFTGTLVPSTEFHQRAMEVSRGGPYADLLWWNWSYFPAWAYLGFQPKSGYFFNRLLGMHDGWWLAGLFGFGLVWLFPLGKATVESALGRTLPSWGRRRRLAWSAGAVLIGVAFAAIPGFKGPRVVLQFDFEGKAYGAGWQIEGDAFGGGPVHGAIGPQKVLGSTGAGWVNTLRDGSDRARGVLRSPEFAVHGPLATFLIGGAQDPTRIGARLLVDGHEVLRSSGPGGDTLGRVNWDLTPFLGRRARLELFDASEVPGGHLLFDDFRVVQPR